jgi:stage II sporulation protein D
MYDGKPCTTYYSSCDGGATENSENVWVSAIGYLRGVIDPYESAVAGSLSDYYWKVSYTRESLTQRLQNKGFTCSTIVSMHVTQYTDVGNVYTVTVIDDNGKSFSFSKDRIRSVLGVNSIRFTINGEPRPSVGTDTDTGTDSSSKVYVNGSSTTIDLSDTGKIYAIGSSGTSALTGGKVSVIDSGGDITTIGNDSGSSSAVYYTGNADSFIIEGSGNGHNVGMSQWGAYAMAKYYNKKYDEIIKFYFTGVTIQ